MNDFLKPLFVDESGAAVPLTFEQLSERLEASAEINLVNLSDGGYVSKAKYDTKVNGLQEQLNTANDTIKSYTDMDIDGIKASAANWEAKYNTDTAALNAKLEKQEHDHRADMFLAGYKFTSAAAKAGIRALFDQQTFEVGEDGAYKGAKEWMDAQIASDDNKGAFVVDTPPQNPEPGKPTFAPQQPPQPPAKRKTLMQMMAEKNKNPDAPINFD